MQLLATGTRIGKGGWMNKKRLLTVMGSGIKTLTIANPDDTWLFAVSAPDTNYVASTTLNVRLNARHAIMKFDLSSLVGKTIKTAKLTLTTETAVDLDTVTSVYQILAANSDMVFSEMTWNIKKTGTAWAGAAGCATPDTDFNSTSMGGASYPRNQGNTKVEIDLDLTQFNAMIANNYGFILRNSLNGTFIYHSNEAATVAYRPILTVTY